MNTGNTNDWFRGYKNGRLRLITDIRDLLENSEHRVSIISILALLERAEQELAEAEAAPPQVDKGDV